jgi:hypothetical protein
LEGQNLFRLYSFAADVGKAYAKGLYIHNPMSMFKALLDQTRPCFRYEGLRHLYYPSPTIYKMRVALA